MLRKTLERLKMLNPAQLRHFTNNKISFYYIHTEAYYTVTNKHFIVICHDLREHIRLDEFCLASNPAHSHTKYNLTRFPLGQETRAINRFNWFNHLRDFIVPQY